VYASQPLQLAWVPRVSLIGFRPRSRPIRPAPVRPS